MTIVVLSFLFLAMSAYVSGQYCRREWCPCTQQSYGMQSQPMPGYGYGYGYEGGSSYYGGRRRHRRHHRHHDHRYGQWQPPCSPLNGSYGMPPSYQDDYRYKYKYKPKHYGYAGGLRPRYRGYSSGSGSYMSPSSSYDYNYHPRYNMYGAPRPAYAGSQRYGGYNSGNSMHGACRW